MNKNLKDASDPGFSKGICRQNRYIKKNSGISAFISPFEIHKCHVGDFQSLTKSPATVLGIEVPWRTQANVS